MTKYTLPDLDYDYSDLEPVIAAEIMELHHKKHHNTYVTKLNEALQEYAECEKKNEIDKMIALQSAINFNGGGHINHSIFWKNLMPQKSGGGTLHDGALKEAITKQFGSLEALIDTFSKKTVAIQGSGWGWLGYSPEKKSLVIETMPNQTPLATKGLVPLLGIDVWEHAYYLQYKNVRPDYVKAIWSIINWKDVEKRFLNGSKQS